MCLFLALVWPLLSGCFSLELSWTILVLQTTRTLVTRGCPDIDPGPDARAKAGLSSRLRDVGAARVCFGAGLWEAPPIWTTAPRSPNVGAFGRGCSDSPALCSTGLQLDSKPLEHLGTSRSSRTERGPQDVSPGLFHQEPVLVPVTTSHFNATQFSRADRGNQALQGEGPSSQPPPPPGVEALLPTGGAAAPSASTLKHY